MSTTHRPVIPYHANAEERQEIERRHAQQQRKAKVAELQARIDALEKGRTHPKAARNTPTVERAPVRPYFATNT